MKARENSTAFSLSVNARTDGTLDAAYIQIRDATVATTQELLPSVMLLDFDKEKNLVGVEILAPVKIAAVLALADQLESSQKRAFRKFLKSSAPPALVTS